MHFNYISIYACPRLWVMSYHRTRNDGLLYVNRIYIYICTLDLELIWVNPYPWGDLLVFWHCGVISPLCPPPPPPPPPSKNTPPHTHIQTTGRRPHVLIHTFCGSYMLVTPMRYQHWPLGGTITVPRTAWVQCGWHRNVIIAHCDFVDGALNTRSSWFCFFHY